MRKVIAIIKDEPLIHFVIAGALVFFVQHFWFSVTEAENKAQEIVISRTDQNRLTEVWRMQWGRPPSDEELDRLLAAEIREQILYREALILGLDKGDTIIRRRLVQKFQYLNEDIVNLIEPSDRELIEYYDQNSKSYEVPAKVTFSHIYFSPDGAGDPYVRAHEELARLQTADSVPIRAPQRGDDFPIQTDWSSARIDHLEREFGDSFAAALTELPLNAWQGPITSGLGVHLVYLTSRQKRTQPELGDVRDALLRDYLYARKQIAAEHAYQEIRSRYSITVEPTT